ncbi:MAG: glycosyltransferase [Erysipelotrichaceae bacterium]
MKIAILTMFNGLSNTYSLVNVVAEQLSMLLVDHIDVKLLVSEHCPDHERTNIFRDKRIEWIKIINSINGIPFHWKTYSATNNKISTTFESEVDLIANDYVRHLSDVDICIMHDILYQGVHLLHNVAIRKAQKKLPRVHFLSFTHSAPTEYVETTYPINCMYQGMDNTTFIYPTQSGLAALSKQYHINLSQCSCINNSIDVTIGMKDESKHIGKYIDYSKSDILIIYPGRLNTSKRFHTIAQFAGTFKRVFHKSIAIIFCDFPSADIDSSLYKFMIRDLGYKSGLEEKDILFTSDCGFPYGVKRETVLDLFSISNLFICPSYSESFGLTVIEAASRGNLIVLNEAVPALAEIGSDLKAYFMRWSAKNFGYDTYETYHPSEEDYYIQHARNIIIEMNNNPVIHSKTLARTRYSNKCIYESQLKPLLIATKKVD